MYTYYSFGKEFAHPDFGTYYSYGIAVDLAGSVEELIPDITTEKAELEPLIERCNRLNLEPLHLRDVVDDFLSSL